MAEISVKKTGGKSFYEKLQRIFPGLRKKENKTQKGKESAKNKSYDQKIVEIAAVAKVSLVPIKYLMSLNKLLLMINGLLAICLVVLIIEHISMYPLVEKRYSFLELVGDQDNYVKMRYTNEYRNEGLIKDQIIRYVIKREGISTKDDIDYVLHRSKEDVKKEYLNIQKLLKERDVRRYRRRLVKVDRYQKIEGNIRQLEIRTIDYVIDPNNKRDQTPTREEKKWTINIKFEFREQKVLKNEILNNGFGFFVTKYNLKGM